MPKLIAKDKHWDKRYFNFYPVNASYDKVLELTPQSSEYYAIMTQKLGKEMADYYWNRRYLYKGEIDYEWRSICKDINEKCDKFLKSRGIKSVGF